LLSTCVSGRLVTLSTRMGVNHPARAVAQAVSHWPPTAGIRVQSQVNPRGIFGGQSDTWTRFFLQLFPLSIIIIMPALTDEISQYLIEPLNKTLNKAKRH
jgi:hypothetical protein